MENLVHTFETAIELHFYWSIEGWAVSWLVEQREIYLVLYKVWTWISYLCFKLIPPFHWLDMSTKVLKEDKLCKKRNYLMCWRHGPTLYNIGLHIYSLSVIYNFLGRYIQHKFSDFQIFEKSLKIQLKDKKGFVKQHHVPLYPAVNDWLVA